MDLDDVAFRIVEENLLPAAHGKAAIVGIGNPLLVQAAFEGVDVVGAKSNVAPLEAD